jgi:hypothetical protein
VEALEFVIQCMANEEKVKTIHRMKRSANTRMEQVQGVHYEKTYAPVVGWAIIRFFMTLAIINNRHTRQLNFALESSQANIEREL